MFTAITGHSREDVDWQIEDNQAGYYTWLKRFDQLIGELIEDGYMISEGSAELVATEAESPTQYSYLVYPGSR